MIDSKLPLVSVGIPTYNRPEGLRRVLNSITSQTYTNLEIIVSDNCSENGEVSKVIKEFGVWDNRIVSIRQIKNTGTNNNFMFVLRKSSGLYFMWAADDDFFDKDFIKNCVDGFLQYDGVVFSTTSANLVSKDGDVAGIETDVDTTDLNNFDAAKKIIYYLIGADGPNVNFYGLYLRRVLTETNLLKVVGNYWGADVTFFVRLLSFGKFYQNKGYFGFYYSTAGNSSSHKQLLATDDVKFTDVIYYVRFVTKFMSEILISKGIGVIDKIKLLTYLRRTFKDTKKGRFLMKSVRKESSKRFKVYIKSKFRSILGNA